MQPTDTWTPALAILAGGGIAWLSASVYYRKAAEGLKCEAGKLRTSSAMVLAVLQHLESWESQRTSDGSLKLTVHLQVRD